MIVQHPKVEKVTPYPRSYPSRDGIWSILDNPGAWRRFGVHRDLGRHPTDLRQKYLALYLRNFSRRIDFWHVERSKAGASGPKLILKSHRRWTG